MKQLLLWLPPLILSTVGLTIGTQRGRPDGGYHHLTMSDGTRLEFRLTAPTAEQSAYPFLLALPPGAQGRGEVDWAWDNVYAEQGKQRGWVVVTPAAPEGRLFFEESGDYLPELLDRLFERYPPEGDKAHLSGISNGGLAAFRVALRRPDLYQSIAVLPGWPGPSDLARIERLAGIPVKMWAGANEHETRLDLMRRTRAALEAVGSPVELEIRDGEGHNLRSLRGGRELFDWLEKQR